MARVAPGSGGPQSLRPCPRAQQAIRGDRCGCSVPCPASRPSLDACSSHMHGVPHPLGCPARRRFDVGPSHAGRHRTALHPPAGCAAPAPFAPALFPAASAGVRRARTNCHTPDLTIRRRRRPCRPASLTPCRQQAQSGSRSHLPEGSAPTSHPARIST